ATVALRPTSSSHPCRPSCDRSSTSNLIPARRIRVAGGPCMDRLLDERYQFGAIPLGFAEFAGDLAALAIYHQCCRHARNGEVVSSFPRGIKIDCQLFDPDFSVKILDGLDPFAVDGQRYHLEIFGAEATL